MMRKQVLIFDYMRAWHFYGIQTPVMMIIMSLLGLLGGMVFAELFTLTMPIWMAYIVSATVLPLLTLWLGSGYKITCEMTTVDVIYEGDKESTVLYSVILEIRQVSGWLGLKSTYFREDMALTRPKLIITEALNVYLSSGGDNKVYFTSCLLPSMVDAVVNMFTSLSNEVQRTVTLARENPDCIDIYNLEDSQIDKVS